MDHTLTFIHWSHHGLWSVFCICGQMARDYTLLDAKWELEQKCYAED